MPTLRYQDVLDAPDRYLSADQRRFLRQRGLFTRLLLRLLFVGNWVGVRVCFRYSVRGKHHLRGPVPFILAPNHSSPLDPQFLGAALPWKLLSRARWAGKETTVLRTAVRRWLSWLTRIFPIKEDASALAPAATVLEQGDSLVWFPEGVRSRDGELLPFKPGIIQLTTKCDVAIVPVYLEGAHAACPQSRSIPKFGAKVEVRIGPPVRIQELGAPEQANEEANEQANDDWILLAVGQLQRRVAALGDNG